MKESFVYLLHQNRIFSNKLNSAEAHYNEGKYDEALKDYTDAQIENRMKYYHQVTKLDGVIETLFNFKFNKLLLRIFQVYQLKIKDKLGLLENERRKFKMNK